LWGWFLLQNGNGKWFCFAHIFLLRSIIIILGLPQPHCQAIVLRPSSFVSCSHIVAYLKSQFVCDVLVLSSCWCRVDMPVFPPSYSPNVFCLIWAFNPEWYSRSPLSLTCYRLVPLKELHKYQIHTDICWCAKEMCANEISFIPVMKSTINSRFMCIPQVNGRTGGSLD